MSLETNVFSPAQEFVYTRTYSRWLDDENRRETWEETINRYVTFIVEERGSLIPPKVIKKIKEKILNFEVMPSMRALWAAGKAAKDSNVCMYNCSALVIDSVDSFAETLYLLCCGAGVGFSVQNEYISKLPIIPYIGFNSNGIYQIPDTKEGWAESVKILMNSLYEGKDIELDYNLIRPAGARLKTMGGRASGSEPLMLLHRFIRDTFYTAQGRKLNSLECHDILNQIAEIVVVGGVRRSSQISLSDLNDILLAGAKKWPFPLRRSMANNSAVYLEKPNAVDFLKEWSELASSGTGERGIFNLYAAKKNAPERRDKTKFLLVNPCNEIILRNMQFCNLSEVVIREKDDLESLLDKVETATWIGVIQSTFTDFKFLRSDWKKNCDEERLLGVSLTGQMDNKSLLSEVALKALKAKVLKIAKHASIKMGINMPAATTCCKPSGCRPWNAVTITDKGILTLEDLFVNHNENSKWDNFTENVNVVQENNNQSKIIKTYNNDKAEIYKITLNYNFELESTPNHKWFVSKERIPHPTKRIFKEINQWIETKNITKGHVIESNFNNYNNLTNYDLKIFNPLSIKMRSEYDEITQPKNMDEDLAWLLGYLWGDGAMSPGKYRIRFTDQYVFNMNKVIKIIKDKFNLTAHYIKRLNENCYNLDISSKALWHWLIKNDIWKYYKEEIDILPKAIRCSSKSTILAFIAGLIDSDGSVYKSNNLYQFQISTAYDMFANHLQHICWSVGIGIGKSLQTKGKSYQNKRHLYHLVGTKYINKNSFEILKKHSNKITNQRDGIWHFESNRKTSNVLVIGEVLDCKFDRYDNTYDIEIENTHYYFNSIFKSHNTVSQLVNSSSGIHTRYSKYYIRRYRISTHDSLFKMIKNQGIKLLPEVGQEHLNENKISTWIIEFPIKSPNNAIIRDNLNALEQLEWYKHVITNWCEHSVSCTIYVKEYEWLEVGNWVYKNWDIVNGLSFLPYDGGKYKLAPYEEITEEKYNKLIKEFKPIDYSKLNMFEKEDNTDGVKTFACSGSACEII